MIIYWIVIILLALIVRLISPLSLLPDAVLPDVINSSITNISGFIGRVWSFFPLTFAALLGAVVFIVIVENWVLVYKVIRWVYTKIPGIS